MRLKAPYACRRRRVKIQKVLKSKTVSYGKVELVDNGTSWARYLIRVNGQVKEVSENLQTLEEIYRSKYY